MEIESESKRMAERQRKGKEKCLEYSKKEIRKERKGLWKDRTM